MPSPDRVPGGLRRRAARGTLVNAAFMVGLTTLGLVKGLVVAGFMTTGDYGVWGVIFIALGTILALKQVGIGDRYIQQDESDQELAFQRAFTLELLGAVAFALVMLAAVPLVAIAYDLPQVVLPGVLFTLAVPGVALQSPSWIFYRRMEFVRQRGVQAVDPIVGFVVTVALAVAGLGYWSLVAGVFAGAWSGAVSALLASPYRIRLTYDRSAAREYLRFSWPLFAAAAGGVAIAQISIFAGNEVLGLAGAGAITLAATLALYTEKVDAIVTETLYPAVCAVKDRKDLLLESFTKSNRLALMWGVPFGVGLTLFGADLVHYGIGDRWEEAIVLIQVIGVASAVNHVGFNWSAYFRARGDTKPMAVASAAALVTFAATAVPLLIVDGLEGFAIGLVAQTAVALAVRMRYLLRLFPGLEVTRHAARAFAPTVPAAAAVLASRALADGHQSAALAVAELAGYVAITLVATMLLERRLLEEVRSYLRAGRPVPASGFD